MLIFIRCVFYNPIYNKILNNINIAVILQNGQNKHKPLFLFLYTDLFTHLRMSGVPV